MDNKTSPNILYLLTTRMPQNLNKGTLLELEGEWVPIEHRSAPMAPDSGKGPKWINVTVSGHTFALFENCPVPCKIPG